MSAEVAFFAALSFLNTLRANEGGGGGAVPTPQPQPAPSPVPVIPVVPTPIPVPVPSPTPVVVPSVTPPNEMPPIPDTPPLVVPPADTPPLVVPSDPPTPPGTLPAMPPWQDPQVTPVPSSLPPFPGPGWVPDTPVSTAVADRATYWNPQLWDYASKTIKKAYVQEQYGGRWLTFAAAWHPGDQGPQTYMATEAWRLASAQPNPTPVVPVPSTPPSGVTTPGPVGPEPATGAWKTNAAYITKYQTALTWLAKRPNPTHATWDPKGIDGKYGPNTSAAVSAFQRDHGLTVDGQCGNQTAASIDAELGYGAAPQPMPVPTPPPAVVPPTPGPGPAPVTPAPSFPAQVEPYPGPGAYSANSAYIVKYQTALTYIAHATGNAAFDPLGVDGKYGPHTTSAVKAFQAAHGLTQDGECGGDTAKAIDAVLASLPHS